MWESDDYNMVDKYEGMKHGPQAMVLYVADVAFLNNRRNHSYQIFEFENRNMNDGNNQPIWWWPGLASVMKICDWRCRYDFIYGGGDVYFDNCTLKVLIEVGPDIVAPSTIHIRWSLSRQWWYYKISTRWWYVFKIQRLIGITALVKCLGKNIFASSRQWA